MAVHGVEITLPKRELGRADEIFDVKADGVTVGALHVSRGAVVWFPSGTTYGYKVGWKKFDGGKMVSFRIPVRIEIRNDTIFFVSGSKYETTPFSSRIDTIFFETTPFSS